MCQLQGRKRMQIVKTLGDKASDLRMCEGISKFPEHMVITLAFLHIFLDEECQERYPCDNCRLLQSMTVVTMAYGYRQTGHTTSAFHMLRDFPAIYITSTSTENRRMLALALSYLIYGMETQVIILFR